MKIDSLLYGARELFFPSRCACCRGALEGDEVRSGVCGPCLPLLVPEAGTRCVRCGRPLVSEKKLCVECREKSAPEYDEAFVLFRYGGWARRFLASYKFGTTRLAASFVARLFAEVLENRRVDSGRQFVIVPVPPRPGKLKKTGWDQIAAVADRLEREEGCTVSRCLERLPSRTQKKLTREERALNMRGVIVCRGVAPARVVLIDDVLTTGATLNACSEALKKAGSEYIFALAFCYD